MIFSGISDVGKRRATNQDSYSIIPLDGSCTLCTVCDGMGGANGGNVASRVAMDTFTEYVKNNFTPDRDSFSAVLKDAVAAANAAVYEKAKADESLSGMGTTLVSLLIGEDGKGVAVNVGDSRLYCTVDDELRQVTKDHSYVQYLVDMGQITIKEAESASIRNIIIRSVGNEQKVTPDVFRIELPKGGYILLCSDGLTNCVKKPDIVSAIGSENKEELDLAAVRLVELANIGGGTDNITVIVGKYL